jgi:hypothetical protein
MAAHGEAIVAPRALQPWGDVCNDYGYKSENNVPICFRYCEKSSQQIVGAPIHVNQDQNGTSTNGCSQMHQEGVTVTESFTISLGGEGGEGGDDIKAGASAGVSWSWAKSESKSDEYTFNLDYGHIAHVVFHPNLQQSCGVLSHYGQPCLDDEGANCQCREEPYASDQNACGTTLHIEGGKADGVRIWPLSSPSPFLSHFSLFPWLAPSTGTELRVW